MLQILLNKIPLFFYGPSLQIGDKVIYDSIYRNDWQGQIIAIENEYCDENRYLILWDNGSEEICWAYELKRIKGC